MTELRAKEEMQITRMLLTIVLLFGICYSFEVIRRLMIYANVFDYNNWDYYDYSINQLADVFYVLNSSINFVVYCAMGSTFREHCKQLFCY